MNGDWAIAQYLGRDVKAVCCSLTERPVHFHFAQCQCTSDGSLLSDPHNAADSVSLTGNSSFLARLEGRGYHTTCIHINRILPVCFDDNVMKLFPYWKYATTNKYIRVVCYEGADAIQPLQTSM